MDFILRGKNPDTPQDCPGSLGSGAVVGENFGRINRGIRPRICRSTFGPPGPAVGLSSPRKDEFRKIVPITFEITL